MISLAAIQAAAEILGIAAPLLVQGLKAVHCAIEDCDVELAPPASPDLMRKAQALRTELARIATGTDRAAIDAAFARPIRGPLDLVSRETEGLPPVRPDGAADMAEYAEHVDDADTDSEPPKGAA